MGRDIEIDREEREVSFRNFVYDLEMDFVPTATGRSFWIVIRLDYKSVQNEQSYELLEKRTD